MANIATEAESLTERPYHGASRSAGGITPGPSGSRQLPKGVTNEPTSCRPKRRFKVGIDYGTTFSSVSYDVRNLSENRDFDSENTNVRTIKNVSTFPKFSLL